MTLKETYICHRDGDSNVDHFYSVFYEPRPRPMEEYKGEPVLAAQVFMTNGLDHVFNAIPHTVFNRFSDVAIELTREPFHKDEGIKALIADTGFMTLELYSEEFVVAVPSHHPWVNRNYVNSSELKDQTMLLLGAGHCFRDQILGVCPDLMRFQAQASDVQRTVEGSSLQTICHMVAQGLGITVLPASAIPYLSGFSKSLKIIPFKAPVPTRRVLLVWRKSYPRMQAVEAVQAAVNKLRLNGCLPLDEKPRMR